MSVHALLGLILAATPIGDDWPHIRGPHLNGRADAEELFQGEDVGFVPSWTAELGSAYAGVVIGQGRVVTAFSDGTNDILIAFDEKTGSEIWRRPMSPTYRGHDGSDDGVITTPVLNDSHAFALTPHGTLLAARLSDGEVDWSVDFRETFGAPLPEHGFGSTPILEDGRLIVQVGGPQSLCAFDPKSGDHLWSVGDNDVWYQSPLAMDLAGRRQLIVLEQNRIVGRSPIDGSELWVHPLEGRSQAQTGIAGPVDENRFFAFVSSQLAMYQVVADGDAFKTEELWRSRELGRSYAAPIYHDGYLYGFKSDFLTCIDASSGRRVWKSRPPGGRGLIGIGDRLAVFGAHGVTALVRATPEGYLEEDRITALESTGYTWPSFASGALYLRNLDALARVDIVDRATMEIQPRSAITSATDPADEPAFEHFQRLLAESGVDLGSVQEFAEQQTSWPLVKDGFVHLLFEGEVEDVAVTFSGRDGSAVYPMRKLGASPLYYRGFAIEPGRRYEYRFQVDFERWVHDPRNPRSSPALRGGGEVSSLLTEGFAERRPFLSPGDVQGGKVDKFEFTSTKLGNTRNIHVYTPPNYAETEDEYPLLIVHQGTDWVQKGLLPQTLDQRIGTTVRPLIVAFIDPIRRSWLESGGSGTDAYLDALGTEFLDELCSRYRISRDPLDVALMGCGRFGVTAAYGALLHPDTFGKAAVQSIDLGDLTQYRLLELIEEEAAPHTEFYVDWNLYENRNIDRGYDRGEDSRRFFDALRASGYQVTGDMVPDSVGWGSWRSRADQIVEALFPLEEAAVAQDFSVAATISVDWEGGYVLNPNVQAMANLRERFEDIPLTQFLNAAYFARLEEEDELQLLKDEIAKTLRPHDEIGLHIHCWQSLVEKAGVTFRDQPTFFGGRSRSRGGGERGHDVELDAYDFEEIEQLLNFSTETLESHGYELTHSFRCPGWLASPKVLHGARAAGYVVDTSSTDATWHQEELRGRPIFDRLRELWPDTTTSTQPYIIDTPAGTILEMPDTGALADYIDGPQMIGHLEEVIEQCEEGEIRFAHIGFHQETAARYLPRIVECLEHFEDDSRIEFMTLEDAAELYESLVSEDEGQ